MKFRSVFASLVILGAFLVVTNASFAQELFTTQEDFTGWSDNSGNVNFTQTTTAFSTDSSTTNALGNTTAPGGSGSLGSMTVTRVGGGNYGFFYSAGEQSNAGFLSALGTVNNGGNGYSASTVTVEFDYVPPAAGTYFGLGIVLNYNSNFGQFFGGAAVNNGTYFTQDVPITINATGSSNYFQFGFIFNSDAPNGSSFTVDNVRVVPEPATLSLLGLGGCGLIGMAIRRRRS
jgi:hypothetical protein